MLINIYEENISLFTLYIKITTFYFKILLVSTVQLSTTVTSFETSYGAEEAGGVAFSTSSLLPT